MGTDNKKNNIIYYVSIPAAIVALIGYGMAKSKNEKLVKPGAIIALFAFIIFAVSSIIGFNTKG